MVIWEKVTGRKKMEKKWESREKKRKSRFLLSRYLVAWFHFVKLGRSSGVKNDPEPLNIT